MPTVNVRQYARCLESRNNQYVVPCLQEFAVKGGNRLDRSMVIARCDKGSGFGKPGCVEDQRKGEGEAGRLGPLCKEGVS